MPKSHEVGMEKDRPVVDRTNERLGGVQAVVRAAGGRELILGRLGTHHPEVVQGTVRGDLGAAQDLIPLPPRGEPDADVRAEVDTQVALHRVRGQNLCGVRLVGHAARQQLHPTGEVLRRKPHDPEVLVGQEPAPTTGRRTICRDEGRRRLLDLGKGRDRGDRLEAEHLSIGAVGRYIPGKGRRCSSPCSDPGQHQPTHQCHEKRQVHPRAPAMAEFCFEYHSDDRQDDLLRRV